MWVMGDHRLVSQDSRCQGEVPIGNIIGRAFVIVWPSSRFAGLSVPPVWQRYAAAEAATRSGGIPRPEHKPVGAFLIMPVLVSSVISARSGLALLKRRRRLPS